jgi:FkbM family methyltransferase
VQYLSTGARLSIGVKRHYRKLQRRLGIRDVECSFFGARFSVDIAEAVGFGVATGRYEYWDIIDLVEACRRVRPRVFVDVGANLGVFTCIVAPHVERVISFEPDPENFRRLAANLARNGIGGRVELHCAAVGASAGRVGLARPDCANRGLIHVAGDGETPLVRLDDVVPCRGEPIALKVDVEGYEPEVLAGASELLRHNGGYAVLEGPGPRAARLVEIMEGVGWRFIERYGLNLRFAKESPPAAA